MPPAAESDPLARTKQQHIVERTCHGLACCGHDSGKNRDIHCEKQGEIRKDSME